MVIAMSGVKGDVAAGGGRCDSWRDGVTDGRATRPPGDASFATTSPEEAGLRLVTARHQQKRKMKQQAMVTTVIEMTTTWVIGSLDVLSAAALSPAASSPTERP